MSNRQGPDFLVQSGGWLGGLSHATTAVLKDAFDEKSYPGGGYQLFFPVPMGGNP